MVLRHLRYFSVVAQAGSLMEAARQLRVAQPALSRQIKDLEREVGAPLFERHRRGLRVTPAGEALLSGTIAAFDRLRYALQRMRLAEAGVLGKVRVGVSRSVLFTKAIGRSIVAAVEGFPYVDLALHELSEEQHVPALATFRLDVAIGVEAEKPHAGVDHHGIRTDVLFSDVLDGALLSKSHALAAKTALVPRDLASVPLLASFTWVSSQVPAIVKTPELKQLGSFDSLLALVSAGAGWTAAPTSSAVTPLGTVVRPVRGLAVPFWVVIRSRAADRSKLLKNTLAALRGEAIVPTSVQRVGDTLDADISRDLELRQLRALTISLQEGSANQAARHLGISQSAVTRQLQTLERSVGMKLIERTPHGMRATAAGAVLQQEAATVIGLMDRTIARTRSVAAGVAGRCVIGSIPTELTGGVLIAALRDVTQRHPEIAVEVDEMSSGAQFAALRSTRIDIAIGGSTSMTDPHDDPALASVWLADDPMDCVLLPAMHPLAARSWITAAELGGQPFFFIARDIASPVYDRVLQALAEAGLVVSVARTFDSGRILWRFAAESRGWSIGSRSLQANPPPGLVAIPLEGFSVPWRVRLTWRRDEADTTVRQVLKVLREVSA
jgi:DNA-binding transcriptional LysR family regulator